VGNVTSLWNHLTDESSKDYRKTLMLASIIAFGAFALPFASLTDKTRKNLVTASSLWVSMTVVTAVYATMESSYIPLFMRENGWIRKQTKVDANGRPVVDTAPESQKEMMNRGTQVSVLGLLASNVGTLTSLLVGVILTHTSGTGASDGNKSYVFRNNKTEGFTP
jgi:hypothetical protein